MPGYQPYGAATPVAGAAAQPSYPMPAPVAPGHGGTSLGPPQPQTAIDPIGAFYGTGAQHDPDARFNLTGGVGLPPPTPMPPTPMPPPTLPPPTVPRPQGGSGIGLTPSPQTQEKFLQLAMQNMGGQVNPGGAAGGGGAALLPQHLVAMALRKQMGV